MGSRTYQAFLALGISAFGISASASDVCHFGDIAQLQRTVVESAERHALGSALSQWDTEKALVSVDGPIVRIVLMPRNVNLLDPPYFVILAEECGKGRLRAGLQAWDLALRLRRPVPGEKDAPEYIH